MDAENVHASHVKIKGKEVIERCHSSKCALNLRNCDEVNSEGGLCSENME